MKDQIDIMIVEDDMIIAADISMQITKLGYHVCAIMPRGEDALLQIDHQKPDVILMDIGLKGDIDGVETAAEILNKYEIPVIFLTANSDPQTFNRAKATRPFAFITKPFEAIDLERSLELVISRLDKNGEEAKASEEAHILSDRIFVRFKERMIKIYISEILFIEAERAYCTIHTQDKEYLITLPLKSLYEKIDSQHFIRVHRSYVVNLSKVDEFGDDYLVLAKKKVPISRSHKEEVMKRLRTI